MENFIFYVVKKRRDTQLLPLAPTITINNPIQELLLGEVISSPILSGCGDMKISRR